MKIAFRMATPTPLSKESSKTEGPTLLDQLGFGGGEEIQDNQKSNTASKDAEAEAEEAEAEAEAGAEAGPTQVIKKKRERQIAIPKDSATFFRARAKNVKMFKYTADGNLQVPEMRGQPAKVIEIPYYRSATSVEIELDEQQRLEELQGVEREFDETFKLLRAASIEWRQTGFTADVIKYQRDLQRLDAQRTQLRSPLRWTKSYKNLETSRVLLSEIYEKRKIGYPVEALKTRSIAFEKMIRADGFKKPEEAEESEEAEEAEESAEEAEAEEFIVFSKADDVEHGFLSPYTMVEFIFNSTKYNCLLQAYEGERLTLLNRQDIRPILLKSRNPTQIRITAARVTGQIENPRELLINILKALTSQHPNFADSLRETGTSTLVFADPKDGVLGVGMLPADPQITEKEEWKGKNFLGQAWAVVRDALPPLPEGGETKETKVQGQSGGGYTEHGTTRKEATEKRANVLKGYYRHKNHS